MKTKRIVLILLLVALLLRILYIFTLDNVDLGSWPDSGWKIAKNLAEGNGYKMWLAYGDLYSARPPVFPLFMAGIIILFGENVIIAKILLAIFGSLLCLVVYFLAKTMFDSSVGLIAMAISVFYPPLIYWGGQLSYEILTTLFLALAVLFILKIEKNIFRYSFFAGLFLGILIMTRSTAYPLILFVPIWIIFSLRNRNRALKSAFIILASASLVIFPWVLRNYKVHHALVLSSTEGGPAFYGANNPDVVVKGGGDFYVLGISPKDVEGLSEVEANRYYYGKGLDFIKNNPRVYLRLVYERFIRFWRFYPHITGLADSYQLKHIVVMLLSDTPIILLGLWGLFRLYKKERKQALLFLLIFFNFMLISMFFRSSIRYRIPIMPYLIILSAYVVHLGYKNRKFPLWK